MATIGVLDGSIRVGLAAAQLQHLAEHPQVAKLNPSNLAAGVASGNPGSTTVAGTLMVARHVGLRVFATGGIGGVHREVGETGDVSADLQALSRCPVAVVCAGAKAVLDLPRTLEALESLGVPVWGLGTREFPAFYRRSSGLPVDHAFEDVSGLARALAVHLGLGTGSGVVVANPVPPDDEMPASVYDGAIDQALADARSAGIRGRAVTPFLLDRMRQITGGLSMSTNRALLTHNARVAGRLAVALAAASPGRS